MRRPGSGRFIGEDMYFFRCDPSWQGEETNARGTQGNATPSMPLSPQNLRFMNEDDARIAVVVFA